MFGQKNMDRLTRKTPTNRRPHEHRKNLTNAGTSEQIDKAKLKACKHIGRQIQAHASI